VPSPRRIRLAVATVSLVVVGLVAAQAIAAPSGSDAPTKSAPRAAPALTLQGYVALGDSYSSGVGAGNYAPDSASANNSCDRSTNSYAADLDADEALGALTVRACSGATTSDLTGPNHDGNIDVATGASEAAQLSFLRPETKYVSLTIGGNDLGFSSVLGNCVYATYLHFTIAGDHGCAGSSSLRDTLGQRIKALAGLGAASSPDETPIASVLSVLTQIHADAPHAQIFVAGYPRLFASFSGSCTVGSVSEDVPVVGHVHASAKISAKDAAYVDEVTRAYDALIADAAADAHTQAGADVTYVDPDPYFAGHRLCDSGTKWINQLSGSGSATGSHHLDSGSFHPTATGQRSGYERAFIAAGLSAAPPAATG
jgi:lysophospholipase L1-like esterase